MKEKIEIWKDIKDYEGLYQISNLGRIRSLDRKIIFWNRFRFCEKKLKGKILKISKHPIGYLIISLNKEGKKESKKISRLVAEAFILNPENKPEINHKDGNKENNNDWNLEWVTGAENVKHAFETGLNYSHQRKLSYSQVYMIKWLRKYSYVTRQEWIKIAKILKVSFGTIEQIIYYNNNYKNIILR